MNIDPSEISEVFATASLGAPENAIGFVLWRVFHKYQREVDRVLKPLDLTHLQFTALTLVAWLNKNGAKATQGTMSRFGDMHKMQISLMLKALEKKLLIKRSTSPEDVRAKLTTITRDGLSVLHAALPLVVAVQRKIFGEEGIVGGALLKMLLEIDQEYSNVG